MTDDHIGGADATSTVGGRAAASDADVPDAASAPSREPDELVAEKEIELAVVTMRFDALDDAALFGVLAKYVVLTRMVEGCRYVDLCSSVTTPGRHLIIQKWDDADAQRSHFDSELMVEMAQSCTGLLSAPPDIDLWDGTSAHDLA